MDSSTLGVRLIHHGQDHWHDFGQNHGIDDLDVHDEDDYETLATISIIIIMIISAQNISCLSGNHNEMLIIFCL